MKYLGFCIILTFFLNCGSSLSKYKKHQNKLLTFNVLNENVNTKKILEFQIQRGDSILIITGKIIEIIDGDKIIITTDKTQKIIKISDINNVKVAKKTGNLAYAIDIGVKISLVLLVFWAFHIQPLASPSLK